MKQFLTKSSVAMVAVALLFASCEPTIEPVSPSAGTVDFSNYVAVGNSLTAGYSDGGLYTDGQINSYPNILAAAMQATGKGPVTFNQPLFGANSSGSGYLTFTGFSPTGLPIITNIAPDMAEMDAATSTPFKDVSNGMSLHNLGVPGISIATSTLANYSTLNPFYERMLPDSLGNYSYLRYIGRKRPTFFTNWMGNNDVLGYAISGGTDSLSPITQLSFFEGTYKEILDSLMRTASKGLIATIPDVTSSPYFTTVPSTPIVLTVEQAAQLQSNYSAGYNVAIKTINATLPAGSPKFDTARFVAGPNVPLIEDKNPLLERVGFMRPLRPKSGEIILLTASASLATGQGTRSPLMSRFVLDSIEVKNIQTATEAFNTFIRAQATSRGLALFDAQIFLRSIRAGKVYFDGNLITASFISGGAFSLDGIHPTKRGYALIANEMMKAINAKYGSNLSPVNAVNYPGVKFPN